MKKLDGKNVVITGAASGLGRSLALALASRGCRIGIADINWQGAKETLELVIARGGSGGSLSGRHDQARMKSRPWPGTSSRRGGVDLLINNAGVIVVGPVGGVLLADWEWVMGTNFWGMLYGCHSFIPRMKARGGGHILNVASSAGLLNTPDMAALQRFQGRRRLPLRDPQDRTGPREHRDNGALSHGLQLPTCWRRCGMPPIPRPTSSSPVSGGPLSPMPGCRRTGWRNWRSGRLSKAGSTACRSLPPRCHWAQKRIDAFLLLRPVRLAE